MDTLMTGKPCGRCGGPRELRKHCVPCHKAQARATYAAHPERWVGYHAKRMAEHRDETRATTKAWKKANPERHREYARNHNAAFRAANPHYQAEWARANPEAARQRTARYRAAKYFAFGSHTDAEWATIVQTQGGKCAHCAKPTRLERDHIVPISLGGSDMAVNIQGLCRSCNASKSNALPAQTQLSVFDRVAV